MVKASGSVDGLPWARAAAKKWIRNEGYPTIREQRNPETLYYKEVKKCSVPNAGSWHLLCSRCTVVKEVSENEVRNARP